MASCRLKFAVVLVMTACQLTGSLEDAGSSGQQLERFRRASRIKRVIGGYDVTEGAWPWLAHLRGKIPSGSWWRRSYKNYYCGGSILNKRWILTAAHCFAAEGAPDKIMTPKHWHIKAGEIDSTHSIWDSFEDFICKVLGWGDCRLWYEHGMKIVLHPEYDPEDYWKNDIALVKLDTDLPVDGSNPNIGTTTLPDIGMDDWPGPGTECIMKGWGCTEKGGPVREMAKQVPLPAQDSQVCDRVFGRPISETRLCAGQTLEGTGICAGDSGGPLVCRQDGSWVQAGIASFTSASNPGDVPGVFTRVSKYRAWIDQVLREN